jgi:hypothetical protein
LAEAKRSRRFSKAFNEKYTKRKAEGEVYLLMTANSNYVSNLERKVIELR